MLMRWILKYASTHGKKIDGVVFIENNGAGMEALK